MDEHRCTAAPLHGVHTLYSRVRHRWHTFGWFTARGTQVEPEWLKFIKNQLQSELKNRTSKRGKMESSPALRWWVYFAFTHFSLHQNSSNLFTFTAFMPLLAHWHARHFLGNSLRFAWIPLFFAAFTNFPLHFVSTVSHKFFGFGSSCRAVSKRFEPLELWFNSALPSSLSRAHRLEPERYNPHTHTRSAA